MAFTDEQKSDHISELQHQLYVISQNDRRIPSVVPDGIYGEETQGAVRAFQNVHGINVTGETDPETWDKIAEQFRKYSLTPLLLDIFPEDFILVPNSGGDLVYVIQILLNILSREYDNFPAVEINGIYSPQMHEAVLKLQEISGADNGINGIGTETWNILASKANSKDFSAKP